MGKLRYYYGAMNSLKTGTLLTKVYQFEQCGCNTILLKPFFDTRDVEIKSRAISDSRPCISFGSRDNLLEIIPNHMVHDKLNVVFVDEVNFITKYQVRQLWKLSKEYDVDVFVYGLKTNYLNRLFEASEELLILADTIEEIKSMCSRCYNKATTHLRYVNNAPVFSGESHVVGDIKGKEYYVSVCQECWHKEYEER